MQSLCLHYPEHAGVVQPCALGALQLGSPVLCPYYWQLSGPLDPYVQSLVLARCPAALSSPALIH